MSWFEDLFINEAKPALNRHSGSGGSSDSGDKMSSIELSPIGAQMANLRGYWDVETITLDFKGGTAWVVPSYMAMAGEHGGKIIFKNFVQTNGITDLLRSVNNVSEIIFEGGLYPSGAPTRVGPYFSGYGEANSNGYPHRCGACTIRGIHLDNITSLGSIGTTCGGDLLNILWEGTLYESTTCNARAMTAESINALVQCLADYSDGETHTLTLGNNLAKVTDENKTLAAARNWTLVG